MKGNSRRTLLGMGAATMAGIAVGQNKPGAGATKSPAATAVATTLNLETFNNKMLGGSERVERNKLLNGRNRLPAFTLNSDVPSLKRVGANEKKWEEIKEAVKSKLNVTEADQGDANLTGRFTRIEHGFAFEPHTSDTDFSYFHVEPLLDQAADLLDRGLRDRAAWDELGAKWASLTLELREFVELDEIHQREEAAGLYDVPYKQSYADYRAESETRDGTRWTMQLSGMLLNSELSHQKINEVSAASQKSNWLSGLVSYSFGDADFNGYSQHTFNGVTKTVANHLFDSAVVQSFSSLAKERSYAQIQQSSVETANSASSARVTGFEAKYSWDFANARFLRERTLVARRLQELKSRLATEQDGLLNYAKRLDSLKQRFHSDFRDALARLIVARIGLREIYGFDSQLPSDENSSSYFDDCLLWCRRAVQWIIRFSRMEQSVVFPISLREAIGDVAWNEGYQNGLWRMPVKSELFANMYFVRVRGISAVASVSLLSDHHRIWQIEIQPPSKAVILHEDGNEISLDQHKVPPAKLCRVATRNAQREPDVVGVAAWFNISPIGDWVVRLAGSIPSSHGLSLLNDICLEVVISYRFRLPAVKMGEIK